MSVWPAGWHDDLFVQMSKLRLGLDAIGNSQSLFALIFVTVTSSYGISRAALGQQVQENCQPGYSYHIFFNPLP